MPATRAGVNEQAAKPNLLVFRFLLGWNGNSREWAKAWVSADRSIHNKVFGPWGRIKIAVNRIKVGFDACKCAVFVLESH